MIILPIKKQWFDMILNGEKIEEYREIKTYWAKRIYSEVDNRNCAEVLIRNGYSENAPALLCKCHIRVGKGIQEWGADPDKYYYVFKIIEIKDKLNLGDNNK